MLTVKYASSDSRNTVDPFEGAVEALLQETVVSQVKGVVEGRSGRIICQQGVKVVEIARKPFFYGGSVETAEPGRRSKQDQLKQED